MLQMDKDKNHELDFFSAQGGWLANVHTILNEILKGEGEVSRWPQAG